MALGFTKSEQFALIGVIGLIVGGLVARQHFRPEPESIWIESDGKWSPVPIAAGLQPIQSATPAEEIAAPPSAHEDSPAAIDLNSANEAELTRLPGIGPAKARAILEHRRSIGHFQSVDQLVDVRGIGPATLNQLRPYAITRAPNDGAAKPEPRGSQAVPAAAGPRRININTASAEELEIIPGIGPQLAARILRHRRTRPFQSPDDLLDVNGIGPRTLDKIRPWIATE